MSTKTLRTVRKDLTILTSLALLGLSLLTGMGMDDEAEAFLPVADVHPLIGYSMALVAGLHALLQLGTMRSYVRKRLRDLAAIPCETEACPPPNNEV